MTKAWATPVNLNPPRWREKIARTPLSPSLLAKVTETNRLWEECKERGGHIPSGKTVMRFRGGNPIEYAICGHCEIPFGGSGRRSPYAPPELR